MRLQEGERTGVGTVLERCWNMNLAGAAAVDLATRSMVSGQLLEVLVASFCRCEFSTASVSDRGLRCFCKVRIVDFWAATFLSLLHVS